MVRPVNQCRTEIFLFPGELHRGPGVRVVAVAEHRDIDEVNRRDILPDLGVNVRQIDPLINPVPDPVLAGIGNVRPRDRLQARDRSSLDSLLEGTGVEPSVPREAPCRKPPPLPDEKPGSRRCQTRQSEASAAIGEAAARVCTASAPDRGSQVRTRLPAGGRWIRTLGRRRPRGTVGCEG
jgi:hypothetical protein